MEANNIILFPNSPSLSYIKEPEDVDERIEQIHLYHVHETIQAIAPILFGNLDLAGFHMDSDSMEEAKDSAFIIEAVRSVLCKKYQIYHPFQQVAENIFNQDPDDENALRIADFINVKLKSDKDGITKPECEAVI